MKEIQKNGFMVSGFSVRTSNQDEMNPGKGKIAGLWQDFSTILHREGIQPTAVYGVYSDYASDEHGEYDVTAAITGVFPHAERRELHIPSGRYLRFEKQGPLPGAALALWQEIWDYFRQGATVKRTYLFDFEEYTGPKSVAIYIGIKEEV